METIIIVLLYILPSIIAAVRGHRNGMAICALNLLLGWTFIGWIAAIIWSFTDNSVKKPT